MMRNQKQNVVYSTEFRDLVLRAYPDDSKIKELLDQNAYFLGRYLDDGCCGGRVSFSADEILVALALGTVNDFVENMVNIANKEKLRALAYKMWGEQWFED